MRKRYTLISTLSTVVAIIFLLQCCVQLVLANPVGDFIQPPHTIAELDGYLSYNGEPVDTFYIYCARGVGIKDVEMNAAPVNDIHFTLKVDWDGDGDWEIDEVVDEAITSFPWYWERTNSNNPDEKIKFRLWYSVGGVSIPIDKLGLLAPYIGLASTIIVVTAATAIYAKRVKRRKEKQ